METAARRRQTEVLRNLDDPVKLLGVLSIPSCLHVMSVFVVSLIAEWPFHLWSGLLGPERKVLPVLVLTLATTAVLAYAEKQEDEYFATSVLAYYLSGRWLGVFSGAAPGGYPEKLGDPRARLVYALLEERQLRRELGREA